MRVFRSLLSLFLFILIFISLSCFLPPQVKAEINKQNLTAVSGPKVGEVTLYWQMADSEDNYHLVYGREKDKFEYGALRIGRITSFKVQFLSPGTTYYFALVPLMGERPLYTTGAVKAMAKRPVKVVEVVEVRKEDLIQPEPKVSLMPETQPEVTAEVSPPPQDELEEEGTPDEVYYQEGLRSGGSSPSGVRRVRPVCQRIGTSSAGWYWPAVSDKGNRLLRLDKCQGCYALCQATGTRSEGWYSSCNKKLITYAKCSNPPIPSLSPRPSPCPLFRCVLDCPSGFVTDDKGCDICRCKPTGSPVPL